MLKKSAFAIVMILALTCTACATAPEQSAEQPRAERSERRNTSCPAYAGCRTYPQSHRDGSGDSQNAATYPRGPF